MKEGSGGEPRHSSQGLPALQPWTWSEMRGRRICAHHMHRVNDSGHAFAFMYLPIWSSTNLTACPCVSLLKLPRVAALQQKSSSVHLNLAMRAWLDRDRLTYPGMPATVACDSFTSCILDRRYSRLPPNRQSVHMDLKLAPPEENACVSPEKPSVTSAVVHQLYCVLGGGST